jgi:hypothetical protein
LIGKVLIDSIHASSNTGMQFTPPLIANTATKGADILGSLIAVGIIFTTPHIVSIVKAAVKAPKIDLGPIGESVGAGRAVVGGFAGGATGSLFRKDQAGNPLGPGAVFMSRHVTNPVARVFLGMQYKSPKDIEKELAAREGAHADKGTGGGSSGIGSSNQASVTLPGSPPKSSTS